MRRFLVVTSALLGLLGLGLVAAPPAAADIACDGVIKDQTVPGSIVVPSGAFCELRGTTVQGSVTVEPGAGLFTQRTANGDTQILGGVSALRAFVFIYRGTSVLGSVDIARPRALGEEFVGAVCDSRVGSELFVHNAPVDAARDFFIGGAQGCPGNEIGASVRVIANQARVVIGDNTIGANLDCRRNNPAPVSGGFNTTTGIKTGQCKASQGF